MPVDFDKCVSSGGKVRTKDLGGGKYIHICYKGGKSHSGEVKHKNAGHPKGKSKYSESLMK